MQYSSDDASLHYFWPAKHRVMEQEEEKWTSGQTTWLTELKSDTDAQEVPALAVRKTETSMLAPKAVPTTASIVARAAIVSQQQVTGKGATSTQAYRRPFPRKDAEDPQEPAFAQSQLALHSLRPSIIHSSSTKSNYTSYISPPYTVPSERRSCEQQRHTLHGSSQATKAALRLRATAAVSHGAPMNGQAKHQRRRCLLFTLLGPLAFYFGSPGFALSRRALLAAAAAPWAPQAAEAISGGGKADLGGSDFTKADMTGAGLEMANLDDVILEGANLEGAYFSESILKVKSLKDAVLTDAMIPPKVLDQLCSRPDVWGGGGGTSTSTRKEVRSPRSRSDAPERQGVDRPERVVPGECGRPPYSSVVTLAVHDLVGELKERDQSYLPEQYFLVKKLPVWRHIEVKWNCEVNPMRHMDTRGKGLVTADEEMPKDWLQLGDSEDELREKVPLQRQVARAVAIAPECARHDPGSSSRKQPWFLDKPPREALAFAKKQFQNQDPRGMIALSVSEWLSAVEDLVIASSEFSQGEDVGGIKSWVEYEHGHRSAQIRARRQLASSASKDAHTLKLREQVIPNMSKGGEALRSRKPLISSMSKDVQRQEMETSDIFGEQAFALDIKSNPHHDMTLRAVAKNLKKKGLIFGQLPVTSDYLVATSEREESIHRAAGQLKVGDLVMTLAWMVLANGRTGHEDHGAHCLWSNKHGLVLKIVFELPIRRGAQRCLARLLSGTQESIFKLLFPDPFLWHLKPEELEPLYVFNDEGPDGTAGLYSAVLL
ncbi:hypothetical protein AK812_SmicGene14811 [Symbiodinium microadriaticum]|uniref:Uncharacterized protein n=1 Tax=Symbiodinium microadriaticum TaxID=2951 RepID=A0A1Q9E4H3_SYMMI|nr:hypothetical protein AK812_SmicGene14811 [Symbiodinium microadriaticum]